MTRHTVALTLLSALMAVGCAQTSDFHSTAKREVDADYKAARAQCRSLQGNARDICDEEARARARVDKAELAQRYQPSAQHQRELDEAKARSTYDVARERCSDNTGPARRSCEQQARDDYEQARADIRANRY